MVKSKLNRNQRHNRANKKEMTEKTWETKFEDIQKYSEYGKMKQNRY